MPTRTIAYQRVSTEKQAYRGVSLDAQRVRVKAYAELYDLELVEVVVDAGESAKSLSRIKDLADSSRWIERTPIATTNGKCSRTRLGSGRLDSRECCGAHSVRRGARSVGGQCCDAH
jgi:hypothetical protein